MSNKANHLPVIHVGGEYKHGQRKGPFVFCYVYSPEGNFLFKGAFFDVFGSITRKFKLCFFNMLFWQKGKVKRSYWESIGFRIEKISCNTPRRLLRHNERTRRNLKSEFSGDTNHKNYVFRTKSGILLLATRRMPRQWVPELKILEEDHFLVLCDSVDEKTSPILANYLRRRVRIGL